MTFEEIKQYNAIVIETAREIAKPWKWTTFILAGLLAGMVALYFLCPMQVEFEQTADLTNSNNNEVKNG